MTQEADKSRRKSGAWETAVHRAATLNLRRISAAKKVASLRHGHHARREDALQRLRLDGAVDPNTFTAWARSFFSLKGGGVPWVGVLVYAAYVCGVAALHATNVIDFEAITIKMSDMSAMGTTVAFLLGFLVNCAFSRWWEGATRLGQAITEYRNAVSHLAATTRPKKSPEGQEAYNAVTRLMLCLPHLIMGRLRAEDKQNAEAYSGAVSALARLQALPWLGSGTCDVWACVAQINRISYLHSMELWNSERMTSLFEKNLNTLMRDLSDCFKLIETPLPFAYMAHIRKLLVLWLLAVPWVLIAEGVGWITVAYAVFVVFALIGLERVAWQLENPFGLDPTDHKLEPRIAVAVLYCLMTCDMPDPAIWRAALTGLASPADVKEVVHAYVKAGDGHSHGHGRGRGEGQSTEDGVTLPATVPSQAVAHSGPGSASHPAGPRQLGSREGPGRAVTWNEAVDEKEQETQVTTISKAPARSAWGQK